LNDAGAGFGHDTNKITIIDRDHKSTSFALKDKKAVAKDIVHAIIDNLHA
jgi:phosphopantothenoylcysteine decarboxylase/phosphopantothenate--cysteine ligase